MDSLLREQEVAGWESRYGREPVKVALRAALDAARSGVGSGDADSVAVSGLLDGARAVLERLFEPSLQRVINGTGVILHTNLGRAPLAPEAVSAMAVALGYSNLEFDLAAGGRGSRHDHCARLLCDLTGAASALVVNNNAAAVALAVNELALDREVIVSRGELVEIGGSFRIPDVVARSGARLVEVGTTNRTRESDYRKGIGPETGLILKVHPSNYRLEGFVESVPVEDLVRLGREAGVPVVHDLGSGLLEPSLLHGYPEEPGVRPSLEAGADLVTWSGDKLLGGPQAGVVLGTGAMIARLRANPLLRAFRVDKLTLAALEATLLLYRDPGVAASRVPALRMLREPADAVEGRATRALPGAESMSATVQVRPVQSLVGGGSFPGHRIASAGWRVSGVAADELEEACRSGRPPLIGRVEEGAFWIDFRTIEPGEEGLVAELLVTAITRLTGE
jgi:L-seryl-tRNA(Ser) seleniumtransferase